MEQQNTAKGESVTEILAQIQLLNGKQLNLLHYKVMPSDF